MSRIIHVKPAITHEVSQVDPLRGAVPLRGPIFVPSRGERYPDAGVLRRDAFAATRVLPSVGGRDVTAPGSRRIVTEVLVDRTTPLVRGFDSEGQALRRELDALTELVSSVLRTSEIPPERGTGGPPVDPGDLRVTEVGGIILVETFGPPTRDTDAIDSTLGQPYTDPHQFGTALSEKVATWEGGRGLLALPVLKGRLTTVSAYLDLTGGASPLTPMVRDVGDVAETLLEIGSLPNPDGVGRNQVIVLRTAASLITLMGRISLWNSGVLRSSEDLGASPPDDTKRAMRDLNKYIAVTITSLEDPLLTSPVSLDDRRVEARSLHAIAQKILEAGSSRTRRRGPTRVIASH